MSLPTVKELEEILSSGDQRDITINPDGSISIEPVSAKTAMDSLKVHFANDEGYAWSWHCNIAMACYDEGVDREIANKIASRFMKLAFSVETKEPK